MLAHKYQLLVCLLYIATYTSYIYYRIVHERQTIYLTIYTGRLHGFWSSRHCRQRVYIFLEHKILFESIMEHDVSVYAFSKHAA